MGISHRPRKRLKRFRDLIIPKIFSQSSLTRFRNFEQSDDNSEAADSAIVSSEKPRTNKICFHGCKFSVVMRSAFESKFKAVDELDAWQIYWSDPPIQTEKLMEIRRLLYMSKSKKILYARKINHFPGMYEICRKDRLSRNLNRYRKMFPGFYEFFPHTWDLPSDWQELNEYRKRHKDTIYIVKPESGCQGRGIHIITNLDTLNPRTKCVCQQYIKSPFLLDGYKFDLRIYVLITCVDPLRIYIYDEGIARLATVKYQVPNESNLDVAFMHLTNYSINKFSETYNVDEVGRGSKRFLSDIYYCMERSNYDVRRIKKDIDDVVIKSLICVGPLLRHNYRSTFPKRDVGCHCFELLGFDILIDSSLKVNLLEVNHSPSYNTDLPVDDNVKHALFMDLFKIIYTGEDPKMDPNVGGGGKMRQKYQIRRQPGTPHELDIPELLLKQFQHEECNSGGFRLLFSENVPGPYESFLDKEYYSPRNRQSDRSGLSSPSVRIRQPASPVTRRPAAAAVLRTVHVPPRGSFNIVFPKSPQGSQISSHQRLSPTHGQRNHSSDACDIFTRFRNSKHPTPSRADKNSKCLWEKHKVNIPYILQAVQPPKQGFVEDSLNFSIPKSPSGYLGKEDVEVINKLLAATASLDLATGPLEFGAAGLQAKINFGNSNFQKLQEFRPPDKRILGLDPSKLPAIFQQYSKLNLLANPSKKSSNSKGSSKQSQKSMKGSWKTVKGKKGQHITTNHK